MSANRYLLIPEAEEEEEPEEEDGDQTLGFTTPKTSPKEEGSSADEGDNRSVAASIPSSSSAAPQSTAVTAKVIPMIDNLVQWLKQNRKIGIASDGSIISDKGNPVKQSNVKSSLLWMSKEKAQRDKERKPYGTKYLLDLLQIDPEFAVRIDEIKEAHGAQTGKGAAGINHHFMKFHKKKAKTNINFSKSTSGFKPQLWKKF